MTHFHRILPFSAYRHGPSRSSLATIPLGIAPSSTNSRHLDAPRRGAVRRPNCSPRPLIEFMEERTMMSNIPVFEKVSVPNGSNPVVQVAPMEQTIVDGNFLHFPRSRIPC